MTPDTDRAKLALFDEMVEALTENCELWVIYKDQELYGEALRALFLPEDWQELDESFTKARAVLAKVKEIS